jgi:2-oxoglutarate dehydrogenase E1 component
MSPKSLLRHKLAVNALEDLTQRGFQTVLGETDDINPKKVERVIFCSGKVYYDLLEARRDRNLEHVAIIRIEQLYPFPEARYQEELERYSKAKAIVWCQEEPRNQGAWYQTLHNLKAPLDAKQEVLYAGRPASASPAVGYYSLHVEQLQALVNEALGQ